MLSNYFNPYYQPYWYSDELEHYGVKGMKWGVRKEYEPTGRNTKIRAKKQTTKPNSKRLTTREMQTYPYSNDQMSGIMEQWYDRAKGIFDNMQEWGKADYSKWPEAWKQAADELEYTDLERAMLLAYQALVEKGLTDRFSVCVVGDSSATDASQVKIQFYDMKNGDTCASIGECMKRKRLDNMKSREKDVDPNAKPVSISKRPMSDAKKTSVDKLWDRGSQSTATTEAQKAWKRKKATKKQDSIWNRQKSTLGHTLFFDDENDELEHYGVLGMKWGVRKDPDKAYEKAGRKLEKLDKKVSKLNAKGAAREQRALNKQQRSTGAILFKQHKAKVASKATRKALRTYQRSQAKELKAYRWNEAMRKTFKDVKVSNANPKYIELGEKYAKK